MVPYLIIISTYWTTYYFLICSINTDQLRTFKQRLTILQEVVRDMNERKKQKKNEDQITFGIYFCYIN